MQKNTSNLKKFLKKSSQYVIKTFQFHYKYFLMYVCKAEDDMKSIHTIMMMMMMKSIQLWYHITFALLAPYIIYYVLYIFPQKIIIEFKNFGIL